MINNISNVANKCTGCTACSIICPKQAIKLTENNEGFLFPIIDNSKCNNCGVCKRVCPVLSLDKDNKYFLGCFAGWSNNPKIVKDSSSGGLFYEIANRFIKNKGVVCGVVLKNNRAVHVIAKDLKQVKKLMGSKYIQSNPSNAFNQIIKFSKNKKILFVGTPCQVAGLKNLVRLKENIKNIFFIDLICHGIPSYKIFDDYIKNNEIISFRDKTFGWDDFSLKIKSDNKQSLINFKKDIFMQTFLSDLGLRYSCYNCKLLKSPTESDITLGDFWGISEVIKNPKGTSAIIVNTKKGLEIIRKLEKSNRVTLKEVDLNQIAKSNPKIMTGITRMPNKRKVFFNILNEKGLDYIYKRLVKKEIIKKNIRYAFLNLKSRLKKLI